MTYVKLSESQWETAPFEFKVATGNGGRFTGDHKFGYNAVVNGAFEDVWSVGGNYTFLSSAETLNIKSTSTDDDGAPLGTGAQKVKIFGLDTNWKSIEEEVTLNGTTNVLTANSYLRINRMYCTDAGSGEVNAGDITATSSGTATLLAQIDTDLGQSLMAIASVPDGFYAIITSIQGSATGLDSAIIDFQSRAFGECWRVRQRNNIPTAAIANTDHVPLKSPSAFPPMSDIKMRAIKIGAGNTIVSASFDYYLIDSREVVV